MTVAELVNELSYFDPQTEVHFSYNYGDHWRTIVAPEITEVELGAVKYSSYHQMDKVVDEEDEQKEQRQVILLS